MQTFCTIKNKFQLFFQKHQNFIFLSSLTYSPCHFIYFAKYNQANGEYIRGTFFIINGLLSAA
nr:MAG TPA: hypothetical protein [Caudoviricetes sp.]